MGSFKRALLGYRRAEVDAALALRDARIVVLQRKLARIPELEGELSTLSGMVIEREREIRGLNDEYETPGIVTTAASPRWSRSRRGWRRFRPRREVRRPGSA